MAHQSTVRQSMSIEVTALQFSVVQVQTGYMGEQKTGT